MQSLSSQMSQQDQQLTKLAEWWQSYSQAIAAYTNQNQQPTSQSSAQPPNAASSTSSNSAAAAAAAQYYGTGGVSSSMLATSGNNPPAPPANQYADFYAQMEKYYAACGNYSQGQSSGSFNSGSYCQQQSGSSGGTHYSSSSSSQQQSSGSYPASWRGRSNERGRGWGRGRGSFSRGGRQWIDHWTPSGQAQDTLKANPEDVFDWWVGPTTNESTVSSVGGHFSSRDDRGSHSRQHDVHRDDHRQHDLRKDDHHSDRYRNIRDSERSRWSPHSGTGSGKSPKARWEDDRNIRGGPNTNKTRSSLPEHPSHTPPKRIPESISFRNASAHMPTNVESLVQQQIQLMMSPLLAKSAPTVPPRQFTVPPTIRDSKQTEQTQTDSHTAGSREHFNSRGVKGDQKRDSTEAGLKATTERSSRSRSRSPVRSKFEDEEEEEASNDGEKKIKKEPKSDQEEVAERSREQKESVEDTMDTAINAKPNRPTTLAEELACQSPDSSNKEHPPTNTGGLEGYDSSKKYGEEYIREVTAFQCFLCGRRFWQQDEVEHHCRSQGHFTNYQKCKLNLDDDDDDEDDK